MADNVYVDATYKSLNKYKEELCGDNVEILKNDDKSSTRIIFLSVFTYYKRRSEANGK